jgi:hypothetical protein
VAGATFKYLGVSKSNDVTPNVGQANDGLAVIDADLTARVARPPQEEFTVPKTLAYNANISLYNAAGKQWSTATADRRYVSLDPRDEDGGCIPYAGISSTNGLWVHWNMTDSCGNTRRLAFTPGYDSYYGYTYYPIDYEHTAAPAITFTNDCNYANLSISNMASLIQTSSYSNGFYAPTTSTGSVYVRVKPSAPKGQGTPETPEWPTGATVIHGANASSITSASQLISFTYSGEYVLQVSTTGAFTKNAGNCVQEYPITVVRPPFLVDRLNTIAYRCPTQGGIGFSTSGQIAVRPINGSGGQYLYELFDKDEDPLTAVPILSKTGNDTQGIFGDNEKCTIPGINYGKSWAEMVDAQGNGIDSVQVRITDLGCGRVTPPTAIAIHNLNNVSVLWTIGSPRKCIGDDLQLRAMALGKNTTYRWYDKEGTLLQSGSNPNLDITNLTVDDGGTYKLIIDVDGCPNITKESEIKISVADKQMYWNPAASDNNWHNNTNWLLIDSRETLGFKESASIPAPCTTVHIAGNALHYPSLDAEATPRIIGTEHVGLPACDTIYYHYGSETAYPHYLDYNRAKVQYNFRYYSTLAVPSPTRPNTLTGTQPAMSRDNANYPNVAAGTALPYMLRNRWYMLSTPLKDMTGGDFSMAGKPMLYQRLYNASEPISGFAFHDTFTRPFNNLAEDASQHGYGLAVLAADGWNAVGWNDHSNLQNTAIQGVIELPVYMDKSNDSDIMKAHLQTYDGSASKFEYFKWRDDGDTSVPVLGPMGVYDTKERGYTGYRFVFENEKDTVSSERYPTSADPMTAIYDLPLGEILAGGSTNRVMIGNPLMCHIDFAKIYAANNDVIKDYYYIVEDASENFIPSYTGDIAPLQGFVVEVLPGRSRDYLRLPLEGAYTVVSQSGWDYQNNGPKPPVGGIDAHPRSAALKTAKATGRIDIIASTPYPAELSGIASGDSIRIAANILFDNEGHSDIPKITFPEGIENKAEVFVVSQDGTQINAAQQAGNQPESLKIGLESKYEKEIVLSFRFEGTLVQSATFIDKVTGIRLTVSNGSRYRFTHRYNRNEGGFEGVDSERFELWPTYLNGDGIENGDYFLTAGIQENELRVLTSETLSQVEVVNAAGTVIHKATDINASRYNRPLQVTAGVYLLNISLSDGRIETRKALITK